MRSMVRVVVATLICALLGFLILATVLRQPVFRGLPYPGGAHTEPRALRAHVHALSTTFRPRDADHPENLDRAAAFIAGEFRRRGARVFEQPFEARGKRYRNVIARFGPEASPLPVTVVGAHYDAFGELPGADDNASGVAGLLELARLLGRASPQRPVELVAYTNEEPPFFGSDLMGSAVHANALRASGRAVEGMICLEMIGTFAGSQSWPTRLFAAIFPTHPRFIAIAGGWSDRRLARKVKRGMIGAGFGEAVSYSGARETSDASDQRNYWPYGWPAVVVTDTAYFRNPHYHTARDTEEKLDYVRMARVVDGVFNTVMH